MFAPKVTKAAESLAGKVPPRKTRFAARPFGRGGVGQIYKLQRSIGNRATARLLAQQAAGPLGRSWFGGQIGPASWRAQPEAYCAAASIMHRKLAIGKINDPLEHEADRMADHVIAAEASKWPNTSGSPQASRNCAACEATAAALKSAHVGQQKAAAAVLERNFGSTHNDPGELAPDIVHRVLKQPGVALPQAVRRALEPRFGADLSHVRTHTDTESAASAKAIGARAYTVGSDIVFGSGEFDTNSVTGRHLLAHELAHVVQQSANGVVRRQVCVPSPMPPAPVPIGAGIPFRYVAAERCLQTHYAATHDAQPGISLSFNRDWTVIAGGSANEKAALACLRGRETGGGTPDFTGASGMYAGEPDIWDFRNQTMYEITTRNGAAERVTKLSREISQANAITAPFDCGGLLFDRGP